MERLIFTLSAGRSGTGYLAHVLSCINGLVATHEPEPKFSIMMRPVLNMLINDKKLALNMATNFWQNVKLPAIKYTLAMANTNIYVETSHLFCKGFVEPLLNLGYVPDAIILKRNPRSIATSLYQLGYIPGRTSMGLQYLLSPDDAQFLYINDWQLMHDYQLCYWYTLEMECRISYYENMLKSHGAATTKTNISNIATPTGLVKLIHDLQLPHNVDWNTYTNMANTKINSKNNQKHPLDLSPQNLKSLETSTLNAMTTITPKEKMGGDSHFIERCLPQQA